MAAAVECRPCPLELRRFASRSGVVAVLHAHWRDNRASGAACIRMSCGFSAASLHGVPRSWLSFLPSTFHRPLKTGSKRKHRDQITQDTMVAGMLVQRVAACSTNLRRFPQPLLHGLHQLLLSRSMGANTEIAAIISCVRLQCDSVRTLLSQFLWSGHSNGHWVPSPNHERCIPFRVQSTG